MIRRLTLLALCALPVSLGWTNNVTLNVRNTELSEVVEMISKQQRVNVLLGSNVSGEVSLNLYDMPVEKALSAAANAAGFALERRGKTYFIVGHDEVGRYADGSVTNLRWYELNYADGEAVRQVVQNYLSRYGKVDFIENRRLLVVEDRPEFLYRIDKLLKAIDKRPRQVLIEAKILEVALNDDENFGIDWANLFNSDGGTGSFGTAGMASGASTGFFFDLVTPNVTVALDALRDQGRVHTLSTPKLVALENEEASVVIGDRRGYRVTTTINQVTTESIEFLESGVILNVTTQIDESGQVLLEVHPEVSTGTVDVNGVPSQTTTEVTTNLLVPTGETVFIGGLIKKTDSFRRTGVPVLNRVPGLRRLFSGTENQELVTETIVLITPTVAEDTREDWNVEPVQRVDEVEFDVPVVEPWVSEIDQVKALFDRGEPSVLPEVPVAEPEALLSEQPEPEPEKPVLRASSAQVAQQDDAPVQVMWWNGNDPAPRAHVAAVQVGAVKDGEEAE